MGKLMIETNIPIGFMGKMFKEIDIALMSGFEEGEGEVERFLHDEPYKYSYKYEE